MLTSSSGITYQIELQKRISENIWFNEKVSFYRDSTFPSKLKQAIWNYIDASKLQLGSGISQKAKLIVFYSRKLDPIQDNYGIIER